MKIMALASIVLHNLVREMLLMTSCQCLHNKNPIASIIRDQIKDTFWNERQSGKVFQLCR